MRFHTRTGNAVVACETAFPTTLWQRRITASMFPISLFSLFTLSKWPERDSSAKLYTVQISLATHFYLLNCKKNANGRCTTASVQRVLENGIKFRKSSSCETVVLRFTACNVNSDIMYALHDNNYFQLICTKNRQKFPVPSGVDAWCGTATSANGTEPHSLELAATEQSNFFLN